MKRRSGFTLVELLVVITILLILSSVAWAVFKTSNADKMRSAARVAQSAFLGAKDRALHAKELRGVRLTRDLTDPTLVNGFVYLQPLPRQTTGNLPGQSKQNNVDIFRPKPNVKDVMVIEIKPPQGTAWFSQDSSGIWPSSTFKVRIPAGTGSWYQLIRQSPTAPYWGLIDPSTNNLNLFLQTPYNAPKSNGVPVLDFGDPDASIDIELGNDVLPFHQPISLSSGIVIDLKYCSTNVQTLAGIGKGSLPNVDIMFSPRGAVSGPVAGMGPLHFLIRDLKDATTGRIINDPRFGNDDST
jgi:prepilin-type N-terminal cleavage/methylation domain-containing protein